MRKRTATLELGEQLNYNYSELTTTQVLEMFLSEKKVSNLSPYTINLYRVHCGVFIRFLQDEAMKPVYIACNKDHYNRFILDQQAQGKKAVSIASTARSIRSWLHWMMENNALDRYKVTIPAFQHTIPESYTDEELAILLEKPKGSCTEVEYETWVFINIAIATGLRLSSILSLKASDIVFSENIIVVNRTKNRKALSLVVNDELLSILKTYIRIFGISNDDFLFTTGEGNAVNRRTMEDFVQRYLSKRGVNKAKKIHAFRHTFARNHYLQTHDMYRLKELMGHSVISTTEAYLGTLGLETSKVIEYNPQAKFIKKKKDPDEQKMAHRRKSLIKNHQ